MTEAIKTPATHSWSFPVASTDPVENMDHAVEKLIKEKWTESEIRRLVERLLNKHRGEG